MTLETIESIENLRDQLIRPKLVQLHPGIAGYESPETFGVYRHDGGKPLGVVGARYNPINLSLMLDSIVESLNELKEELDPTKLQYREYCGGSKVAFVLPLKPAEIKGSPMLGDVIERQLEFRTGFDGLTKTSLTETFRRVWCDNGCTHSLSESFAVKNTLYNEARLTGLFDKIQRMRGIGNDFILKLGKLSSIEFNSRELKELLCKVLGYKDDNNLSTRASNILNHINASVAIEAANTGNNLFSVYNGITRYVTHDRGESKFEKVFYNNANQGILKRANEVIFELN